MWHNGFGYGMDPGFFFIAGFFKVIGWLIFLALIFGAIRFFRRARFAGTNGWGGRHGWGRGGWNPAAMMGGWGGNGRDEALETARERLARSELTPEQFEEMKRALKTDAAQRNEPSGRDDWRDMRREWRDLRRGFSGGNKDNALETARMRFAKGEISAEEFEMIRRALEN
jgi:Short C-terminal domain